MPTPAERLHTNRGRAESFGQVAAQYDRYRPSYPAALIQDLLARSPATGLDIGTGTGKAAVLLAAHGLPMLGVEVDPAMAALARGHGLQVEVDSFESWDPAGRTFDLITCAQAWHWIDPAVGPTKAAGLLRPGGTLALIWNYDELEPAAQSALDAVYAREAPELRSSVVIGHDPKTDRPYAAELEASGAFASVELRTYRWDHAYSAAQWLGMVQTHSDHLQLDPARRARLAASLAASLEGLGGVVNSRYTTYAAFARGRRAGAWQAEGVELLTIPEVAEALGVDIATGHQQLRDGTLVHVTGQDGVRRVPADFIQDGVVVKSLTAVITLLRDAKYSDAEIVDWLYRADDSLPGTPILALRENRGNEVKRRAQAAGY